MRPKIIVCGLGRTGYKIYSLLRKQGAEVAGISDRSVITQPQEKIIMGDPRSVTTLIEAGIRTADTLVLASNDDALNLAVLTQAQRINPNLRIINRLLERTLGEQLDRTLKEHLTMSVAALAAPIFAFAALGNKAIGHLKLLDQSWALHEEVITRTHPWYGIQLAQLWNNLDQMLIYYLPKNGEIDLVSAVQEKITLASGDHLIVATKAQVKKKPRFVWKRWLKILFNINTYRQYARPVIMVTLTLLILITVATLTYLFTNWQVSVADALYFSVGMITGAGGKEEVAESAPDAIKLLTALMMIIGAGIVGIFYALLNDFVLGSRLKQFLDAARVPKSNHYIVCGMGNVGMEVVRELTNQGHEMVVIEPDQKNRFLHSVRSQGIPVIMEDAVLADTLETANIEGAKAIIVVTSKDMTNVEIALTAKALVPKLPVILRIQDNQFAESVNQVFQFENVFSPTEVATHSFVAAALGGKILGNGMTDDLLWVALATMITPNHPFCGRAIAEVAPQADFVPLYLSRGEENIHGWNLLTTKLNNQDVLYLTMPATKLEQLWRVNNNSSPSLLISSYRLQINAED